jgi:hypothetical protein
MSADAAYTEDGPVDAPVVVRSDSPGRSPDAIPSAELLTGALLGHFDAAGATR